MWGSIVLSKISGEVRDRIPAHVLRQPDMDTIENQLTDHYGDSLAVSKLIMQAHERVGEIPDPHTRSGIQGTLRVLQLHSEILEHANRFLELTKEATAASNLVSGANIETLLNLLPQRIRLDLSGLTKAVLDEEERRIQYTKIKEWIWRNKRNLLKQGIRTDETHGSCLLYTSPSPRDS